MRESGEKGKQNINLYTGVYGCHGAHVHHCFSLLKIYFPLMVKFGLGCFFIVQLQTQVTASQNEKNKTLPFCVQSVFNLKTDMEFM